ncbi:MAG TPA: GtrA family protein [bacterium]|nr:GtrA family protein [bacterium]
MCRKKLIFKLKTILRFISVGAGTIISELFFLFIFYKLFHWHLLLATSLAFIISFLANFYLHKFWTFKDGESKTIKRQLGKYLFIAFVNLLINGKLMHVSVAYFHIYYLLSQILVSFIIGIESFCVYNYVIFKKNRLKDDI